MFSSSLTRRGGVVALRSVIPSRTDREKPLPGEAGVVHRREVPRRLRGAE
jgi:hypothetical protein